MLSPGPLLLVGEQGGTHVGGSLLAAAQAAGQTVHFLDAGAAWQTSGWRRRLHWHLLGRRPPRLHHFSADLERLARDSGATRLISTGAAPVTAATLRRLAQAGVRTLNYSTDDPFNPALRAGWQLAALREYAVVATPRSRNVEDLRRLGCRRVERIWFGYDARHCEGPPAPAAVAAAAAGQVLMVGGGDADRLPYAEALIRAGVPLALYGGYWERWSATAPYARGLTDPQQLRWQTACSAVCVGLVRRANRDGHVMRSFEIGASGGCMVAEDTPEHRELFGPDDQCVRYFTTPAELAAVCRHLLGDAAARARLAQALRQRVVSGGHTYADRLRQLEELLR